MYLLNNLNLVRITNYNITINMFLKEKDAIFSYYI